MATGNDAAFGCAVWGELLRARLYAVQTAPTIAIYHQQIVKHGATSVATRYGNLPIIEDGSDPAGDAGLLGATVAVFDENMFPVKYIAASEAGDGTVAGYVMVADHPDQLFVMQEDSDGNAITATEMGQNADYVTGTGSSTTGLAAQEIDSDSAATAAALNLKLHFAHPDDTATENYCRYIVTINEHYYGDTIAGL